MKNEVDVMASVSLIDGHIDEPISTDNTINALERVIHLAEYVCSNYCEAEITIIKNAVDIMKSQKAEIERLTINMNAYGLGMNRLSKELEIAKLEAYKEFAERFEKKIKDVQFTLGQTWEIQCALKQVTKELTPTDTSVSLVDGHIDD